MESNQGTELIAEQLSLYASRNPTRRWLHCSRRDWIRETLGQLTGIGKEAALEVGPGSGIYLPRLAALFKRVVAADVESQYLTHLRPLSSTMPTLEVLQDDVTDSRLPEASFDLVLCTEVLEHISDSRRALRGIHRLLKPGGVLVVTTPQRFSTMEMAMKLAYLPGIIDLVRWIYREPVLDSGHINLMTAMEMRTSLFEVGFSIEKAHKSGLYVPLIAEFGGELGLRIQRTLERVVSISPLQGMLWTQYYVARKRA